MAHRPSKSLSLIESSPEEGFEYPYFLSVPGNYAGEVPMLVEPTNSVQPSEDFGSHRAQAKRRAERGLGRRVTDQLGTPYLQPVFPRPVSDPVNWTHSVHQLCARTIRIQEGPFQRVDRQQLAMIDNGRERLTRDQTTVPRHVMLTGFSASAAFANRFSILYPERIHSVSVGGVNGIVTLPRTDIVTDRESPWSRISAWTSRLVSQTSSDTPDPSSMQRPAGASTNSSTLGRMTSTTFSSGRMSGLRRIFARLVFSRMTAMSTTTDSRTLPQCPRK